MKKLDSVVRYRDDHDLVETNVGAILAIVARTVCFVVVDGGFES